MLRQRWANARIVVRADSGFCRDRILSWCEEHIAGYKKPRAVRIVDPEDMPYGMTLKIRKLELRERFSDLFTGATV